MAEGERQDDAKARARRLLAVALAYDPDVVDAPRVVASGQDELARRIIAAAREHGIEVHEDADLAEVLAAVDIDSVIPLEAFAAVAKVLAYVYRLNGRLPPQPGEGARR